MSRLKATGYGVRPDPRPDEVFETDRIPAEQTHLNETRLTITDPKHVDGRRAVLIEGIESVSLFEGQWFIEARTGTASTTEIELGTIEKIQGVERRQG